MAALFGVLAVALGAVALAALMAHALVVALGAAVLAAWLGTQSAGAYRRRRG